MDKPLWSSINSQEGSLTLMVRVMSAHVSCYRGLIMPPVERLMPDGDAGILDNNAFSVLPSEDFGTNWLFSPLSN